MNLQPFLEKVEAALANTSRLENLARSTPVKSEELLQESIGQTRAAMEELLVAYEELRQQNEELEDARRILEEERQRYQELFQNAPDGYVVTDAYGMIREANRAAGEILGCAAGDLVGRPLANSVPEPERRQFRSELSAITVSGQRHSFEVRFASRPHGGSRWVSITADLARAATGGSAQIRWLLRDETERKNAELELAMTKEGLWRRVAERTHQLINVNDRLTLRVAELEQQLSITPGAAAAAARRPVSTTGPVGEGATAPQASQIAKAHDS